MIKPLLKILASRLIRQTVFLATLIAAALCMGCSAKDLVWTEDVLLPDGRQVTLNRVQKWWKGEEGQAGDYSFEFTDPDTKHVVRWSSDRDLTTIALFKHEGEVYLLLKPTWMSSMSIYRCPNPAYFLRKYSKDSWINVPLWEIPIKHIKANMTSNIFDRYKLIRERNFKIGIDVTQGETVQTNKPPYVAPYVMDFSNVRAQTFGLQNCGTVNLLYPNQN